MDSKIERLTPFLLLSLLVVQIVFLAVLLSRVQAVEEQLLLLNNFFMPVASTVQTSDQIVNIPVGDSPYRGVPDAPITIIEFSDFNCTYCQQVQATLDELLDRYDGQIQIRYKYFPLNNNPTASHFQAAMAAECAYQQGAFWEMHDVLFENPVNWDREMLIEQAKQLDLNESSFILCLDSDATALRIESDLILGREYGVNATPTFFVNGRFVAGAVPIEFFEEVIQGISQGIPLN